MLEEKQIAQVENFWNENLCGHHFVQEDYLSEKFFDEYTSFRYKKTHHLDKYIDWSSAKNKDVLEIGLGIGADAVRWASFAKSYTGIDLTEEAVKATLLHLSYKKLNGTVTKGNAEELSLPGKSFDIVYSFGVLHHTPDIKKAFKEINRILRDDGEFIVMLYAKESFNYWIRIQLYFRIRMIFEILKNKIGSKSSGIWAQHYNNFKISGMKYISWNNFPHHCTDGPDCEIANIFSRRKINSLLNEQGFKVTKQIKAHFPLGGKFPKIERFIGRFLGFHRIVRAKKFHAEIAKKKGKS